MSDSEPDLGRSDSGMIEADKSDEESLEGSNAAIVERSMSSAWAGPLPPPAILDQFNQVVENGAERIFKAWESETAHRHREESRELTLFALDNLLGKIFAFVFVLVALGVSLIAARSGAEWFATILGGGTIGSVVWAFVKTDRNSSEK